MKIVTLRHCLLLAAVVLIGGCGKQERMEADQFAKALAEKKTLFAEANETERGLVKSARAWCGSITANGAGKGDQLDQNAAKAQEMAKSAVAISAQLSEVRKAIDALNLQEEHPRLLRNDLREHLTKRQRTLQDMRSMLETAAPQFLEFKNQKDYAGDSYPDTIVKLNTMLASHSIPQDAVAATLESLKTKYKLE